MSKPLADQIVSIALALERGDLRPQDAGLKLRSLAVLVEAMQHEYTQLHAREYARLSVLPGAAAPSPYDPGVNVVRPWKAGGTSPVAPGSYESDESSIPSDPVTKQSKNV